MAFAAPRRTLAPFRRAWILRVQIRKHPYSRVSRLPSREDIPPDENPPFGVDLPPVPQSYYDLFLATRFKKLKRHEFTGAWLNLPGSANVRGQLPTALRTEPLDVFKDTNADLRLVSRCLEAHIATLHGAKDTKAQMKAAYKSQKVGSRALHWMLESKAYDKYDLLQVPDFFKYLAHSVVAQDAEEYLWKLLHTEHVPALAHKSLPSAMWKGILLRQLLSAQMFWSVDTQAFSSGMRTFQRAIVPSKKLRLERPELFINMAYAGIVLSRFLRRVDTRFIAIKDFESFAASFEVWNVRSAIGNWNRIVLDAEHPAGQDPSPVLGLLRRHNHGFLDDPELYDRMARPGTKGELSTFTVIVKTAKTLHREGRTADAH